MKGGFAHQRIVVTLGLSGLSDERGVLPGLWERSVVERIGVMNVAERTLLNVLQREQCV